MQAILLAAGVGRRMQSTDGKKPKCLLEFGGKSLLIRHLETLDRYGVGRCIVVVGHLADTVGAEAARYCGRVEVELVVNARYREGSIISLQTGLEQIDSRDGVLVMDADVLYHPEVLGRLVNAPFDTGFLLDPRSSSQGEEMMLGVRGGEVRSISRRIGNDWDIVGEGVGFFKLRGADAPALLSEVRTLLGLGQATADYESAIDRFLRLRPAHYALVSDLPWTEIDFDEDVDRARTRIMPDIADSIAVAARAV